MGIFESGTAFLSICACCRNPLQARFDAKVRAVLSLICNRSSCFCCTLQTLMTGCFQGSCSLFCIHAVQNHCQHHPFAGRSHVGQQQSQHDRRSLGVAYGQCIQKWPFDSFQISQPLQTRHFDFRAGGFWHEQLIAGSSLPSIRKAVSPSCPDAEQGRPICRPPTCLVTKLQYW